MKLIFLGTGSAFTVGSNNYHSNLLVETNNKKRLLIDCGSDARFSLFELGYNHKQINAVYISHLHADHVGGLEWLAFNTKFDPTCKKPSLFVSEKLIKNIWEKVLSGGLSSLKDEKAELSTYFSIKKFKEFSSFNWEGIKFQTIKTIHFFSGKNLMPSYGLFFKLNQKYILYTADTQFCPEILMKYYKKADIIFHDCETTCNKSGVHSHYDQLRALPLDIKNKMWLYHYNPGLLPNSKKDGFKGFVKKGQTFEF